MERLKAQWAALPSWQKTLLLAVVPVVLMGVIWYYLITPTKDEIERLKAEESKLRTEIQRLKKLADPRVLEPLKARIENLKSIEEKLWKELEQTVGQIPTEEELDQVLKNIYKLSKMSRIALLDAKFEKPQKVVYEIRYEGNRKIVAEKAQTARRTPPRRPARGRQQPQQTQKAPSVEFYKANLKLSVRGKTSDIFRFMKLLEKRGIPSYPVSISLKPEKEGMLKANITLVLILQKADNKEGA